MGWPIVMATGGPRERGRAYGQAARDRVHGSIELYRAIFSHYTGLTWDQVRGRAGAFVEPIDALDVQLLPEMEGIAEGAAVDAEDVLALNVRTEVMYGLGAPGAAAAECTALGLAGTRSAAGHVVVAENWDWKPRARDTCVLLVMVSPDRTGFWPSPPYSVSRSLDGFRSQTIRLRPGVPGPVRLAMGGPPETETAIFTGSPV